MLWKWTNQNFLNKSIIIEVIGILIDIINIFFVYFQLEIFFSGILKLELIWTRSSNSTSVIFIAILFISSFSFSFRNIGFHLSAAANIDLHK